MIPAPREPRPAPDLDVTIAHLLTIGTYISIGLLTVGYVLMLAGGISPLDPAPTLDPAALVGDIVGLRATGFLWLGLLTVIATPTARIVAALVGYLRQGEREMTLISTGILVVLALSVVLARLAEA